MDLISKKELLEQTGISYGQLYRWKRERLIPEDWVIKQASYTGQETFFPREQILSRVTAILQAKDQYSLEELAAILSPEAAGAFLSAEKLAAAEEIDSGLFHQLSQAAGPSEKKEYTLLETALLAELSALYRTENQRITGKELAELALQALPAVGELHGLDHLCTVFRSGERLHLVLSRAASPLYFDSGVKVLLSAPLGERANQLKLKYPAGIPAVQRKAGTDHE